MYRAWCLLTRLAVTQICHPEILMVGVDERDERSCAIHTEPGLLPIRATVMLIVDYIPNFGVREIVEAFETTEKVEYIVSNRVIESDY